MDDFPKDKIIAQGIEHEAWLCVVKEWRETFPDHDFNDPMFAPIIKAIEYWGETLVALREYHEPSECERILAEKRAEYEGVSG